MTQKFYKLANLSLLLLFFTVFINQKAQTQTVYYVVPTTDASGSTGSPNTASNPLTPSHSIEEVVNYINSNATGNDIVQIAAGTYTNIGGIDNVISIDVAMTLRGPNARVSPVSGTREAEAILQDVGAVNANNGFFLSGASVSNVTIEGLTLEVPITSNTGIDGTTIQKNIFQNITTIVPYSQAGASNITVHDNLFQSIGVAASGQIIFIDNEVVDGDGNIVITHNKIDAVTTSSVDGIRVEGGTNVTISGNRIQGFGASAGSAIYYFATTETSNIAITHNHISNIASGGTDAGVRIGNAQNATNVLVAFNKIEGSNNGVALRDASGTISTSLFVNYNDFSGTANTTDIRIGGGYSGGALIADNNVSASLSSATSSRPLSETNTGTNGFFVLRNSTGLVSRHADLASAIGGSLANDFISLLQGDISTPSEVDKNLTFFTVGNGASETMGERTIIDNLTIDNSSITLTLGGNVTIGTVNIQGGGALTVTDLKLDAGNTVDISSNSPLRATITDPTPITTADEPIADHLNSVGGITGGTNTAFIGSGIFNLTGTMDYLETTGSLAFGGAITMTDLGVVNAGSGDIELSGFDLDLGQFATLTGAVADSTATTEDNKGGAIRVSNRSVGGTSAVDVANLGLELTNSNNTTNITNLSISKYFYEGADGGANTPIFEVSGDVNTTSMPAGTVTLNIAGGPGDDLWNWVSGTGWTEQTVGGTSIAGLTGSTLDAFWVTAATDAALPITLLYFEATRTSERTVSLNWATTTEKDNAGFEIEMSSNAKDFKKIGFVEGSGTSVEIRNYEFVAQNTQSAYYRFKQVDFDGGFEYSDLKFVSGVEIQRNLTVAPNPSSGAVTLDFGTEANENENFALKLSDTKGQLIFETEGGLSQINEALNQILAKSQTGMYILEVQTGEKERFIQRIVLK